MISRQRLGLYCEIPRLRFVRCAHCSSHGTTRVSKAAQFVDKRKIEAICVSMRSFRASGFIVFALIFFAAALRGAPPFSETGVAFLEKHCVSCHGKEKQKAGLA